MTDAKGEGANLGEDQGSAQEVRLASTNESTSKPKKIAAQYDFRHTAFDVPEHSSAAGAHALAERIAKFWADKGHKIQTRVIMVRTGVKTADGSVFGISSNMVGGLPVAVSDTGAA